MNKNRIMQLAAALLPSFLVLLPSSLRAQGSLTPPGAPAPGMKTLSQIEPRTPVATNTTPGDSGDSFVISQPGSYYLTTNILGASGKNGISISCGNVTLDLHGFTMQGVPGSLDGIVVAGTYTNTTVRNGVVTGWGDNGVDVFFDGLPRNTLLEHLTVSANSSQGIITEADSVVRDCLSQGNGDNGIYALSGLILDCAARDNDGDGIYMNSGAVRNCHSEYNAGDNIGVNNSSDVSGCVANYSSVNYGIHGALACRVQGCSVEGNNFGIVVGDGSSVIGCNVFGCDNWGITISNNTLVKDCSVYDNFVGITSPGGSNNLVIACSVTLSGNSGLAPGADCNVRDCNACNNAAGVVVGNNSVVSGCVANSNATTGIYGISRVTVTGCTANANLSFGITVGGESIVTDCHASANGVAGTPAAGINTISVGGTSSRVDGNQVRDNIGYGIQAGSGDVVIRNFAGNNSTNYIPSSGANFGPVQTPSTATSPMANVTF